MEENIINSIIDNFDYVYILMVNIITYGLIKIFDSLNGPKPVSVLAKRIITTISMIIMFCIYYFNEYENIIKLIEEMLLSCSEFLDFIDAISELIVFILSLLVSK